MNFQNQSLSVDYITLNLKNGKENLLKIMIFFNRYYQFNCYYCDEKIGLKSKKPYLNLVNSTYKLEMLFVLNSNPVNRNTILMQFSGLNSRHLNDLSLGRFDITYIRSNQIIQKSNLLFFYQRSVDKFKNAIPIQPL
jgi:hypothetical protein